MIVESQPVASRLSDLVIDRPMVAVNQVRAVLARQITGVHRQQQLQRPLIYQKYHQVTPRELFSMQLWDAKFFISVPLSLALSPTPLSFFPSLFVALFIIPFPHPPSLSRSVLLFLLSFLSCVFIFLFLF